MLEGLQFDLETSAILAAVYVAEGFRRIPGGAVVFRRVFGGAWTSDMETLPAPRWQLVSWCPPFATSVIVPAYDDTTPASRRPSPNENAGAARSWALTINGALIVVLLIPVLPAAAASRGSIGFLIALGLLFLLCIVQAAIFARRFRSLVPVPPPRRIWLSLLSPFKAPRAAELLMEGALQRVGPLRAARTLLPRASFEQHVRPSAYDLVVRGGQSAELAACFATADLRRIIDATPDFDGPFCPRCARTYVRPHTTCDNCAIALVTPRAVSELNAAAPHVKK